MSKKTIGAALSAPLIAGLMFATSAAQDVESKTCEASADAVTTLPAPLDRWADIVCTDSGPVITGREGWVWIEPRHNAQVVIPSQSFGSRAEGGSVAYFTKIDVSKVTGEEFERAYEVFHAGFDPKDAKPAAYRLDIVTAAGNEVRLYLFDYFTYGWGMACSKDACDASSRFVMLNLSMDPKPLQQPI
jgi:hypothetical protein